MAEARPKEAAAASAKPPAPVRGQSGAFSPAFYLRQLQQVRDQGAIFTLSVSTGDNERIFYFTRGAIIFSAAGTAGGAVLARKILSRKLLSKEVLDELAAKTDSDCPLLQDVIREKNALDPDTVSKLVEEVLEERLIEVGMWDSTIAFYDLVQGSPPARLYSKETPAVRLSLGLAGLLGRVIPKVSDIPEKILRPLGGTLRNRIRRAPNAAAPDAAVEAAVFRYVTEEGKRCHHVILEAQIAGIHVHEAALALASLVQSRRLVIDEAETTQKEELEAAAKIEGATDEFLNGLLSSMHLAGIYERAQENEKAVDQLRAVAGEYTLRDRFTEALTALRNAIRLGPQDLAAREDLVKALRSANRGPEASTEAVELGKILLTFGLPGRARKAFEFASKLMPKSLGVLWMLSGLLERLGEKEDAIKRYKDIAQISREVGDKPGFLAAQQKLLELEPTNTAALSFVRSYSGYRSALFLRIATGVGAVLVTTFILSWGVYESIAAKNLHDARERAMAAIDEEPPKFDSSRTVVHDFARAWAFSRAARSVDDLLAQIDAEELVYKDRKTARALRLARAFEAEKRIPEAALALREALRTEDRKEKREALESAADRYEKQIRAGKDALLEAARLRAESKPRDAHDALLRAFEEFPWVTRSGTPSVPCLVESVPSGAQVTVDGRPVEGATPTTVDLPLVPTRLALVAQNRETVVRAASPLLPWPIVVRLPRQRTWSLADAPGSAAPALAEGVVAAVCDDRSAVAVDADSGTVRWRAPLGIFDDSDLPPAIVAGTVVVRTNLGAVLGLELATGKELWRRAVRPPPQDVADPAAARPVAAADGVLVREGPSSLAYLAAKDGAVRWTATAKGPIAGAPAATAKLALVASGRGLAAFKLASGAPAWTGAMPQQAVLGPAVGPRGAIAVALESGSIAWFDDEGRPLSTDKVLPAGISALDASPGLLVAGSTKGELVLLEGPAKLAARGSVQAAPVRWVRAVARDVVLVGDSRGLSCLDGKLVEQWRDATNASPVAGDEAKVYQCGPGGLAAIAR
ncbi:PQQ-binding-like beta-propeller repeat protein [bacterium]|nr:PQQ-binding-like beta-propeller repeat protein [bacterium]